MDLFDRNIFDFLIFDTGLQLGGVLRRHRGRLKHRKWDEIERLDQQRLEERAAEIIQEEIRLDKKKKQTERTLEVVKRIEKLQALKNKIVELEREQVFLNEKKTEILKRIGELIEEDELETILMLL